MKNSLRIGCRKTIGLVLLLLVDAILLDSGRLLGAENLAATRERPNIVVIVADDLGYAELGCYGQEKIRTPNLDRLAREGMRLTQFYSSAPVCAPARCCLMTGKHAGHAIIRDNYEVQPGPFGDAFGGQYPLPEGCVTIASLLGADGYRCGAFGKWGLGGCRHLGRSARARI